MTPEEIAKEIIALTIQERLRLWQLLRELEGDDPYSAGTREPIPPRPPSREQGAAKDPWLTDLLFGT